MAFSSSTLPTRSISLPSRVHPTSLTLDAAFKHLKSFQVSSSSTCENLEHALVGLAEMYSCLQDFMQSSKTRQALVDGKLVEEALNESVVLLDSFDAARDVMVTMRQHLQSVQSALRRRRDSSIEAEIAAYLKFRKNAKKGLLIHLGAIKKLEAELGSSCDSLDHDMSNVANVMREARSITFFVLRSVILFLAMPKGRSSRVSSISRLILMKSRSYEKQKDMVNEVGSVDLGLCSLLGHLKSNEVKVELQMVQSMLEKLDGRIEGLESGLDCVFKCLVQNRVALLNIMTQ